MNTTHVKILIMILTLFTIWYLDVVQLPSNYKEYIPTKVSEHFSSIKEKLWSDEPSPVQKNNDPDLPPPPSPSPPKPTATDLENFRKSHLQAKLKASEEVWERYVQKRKRFVGPDPSQVNPWPPYYVIYYWDYFLPTFNCPHTIERIGGLGDGGKWICGFEFFENVGNEVIKPCVVYSFGVARESSFEKEILRRTNCNVYAYDASVTKMASGINASDPRVHFSQLYIGGKDGSGSLTLETIMKANEHEWIDIVKMDIEGSEFQVMRQILNEFNVLPFGQLQIEIHGDQEGKSFKEFYELWEMFELKGLRAFKNEINHWPCVRAHLYPIYVEYSFINLFGEHRLIV